MMEEICNTTEDGAMSQSPHSNDSQEELDQLRQKHRSLFAIGGLLLFAVLGIGAYLVMGFLGLVSVPQWLVIAWCLALVGNVAVLLHPRAQRLGELSAQQEDR